MRIITLLLFTHSVGGEITNSERAPWIKILCAVTLGLGTAADGWNIYQFIRTQNYTFKAN